MSMLVSKEEDNYTKTITDSMDCCQILNMVHMDTHMCILHSVVVFSLVVLGVNSRTRDLKTNQYKCP